MRVQTCYGFGSKSEGSQEELGSELADLINEGFVLFCLFFKELTKENNSLMQQMVYGFPKTLST